ncbi:hypothetical protein GCM10027456_68200 [Kineosporia babensis]
MDQELISHLGSSYDSPTSGPALATDAMVNGSRRGGPLKMAVHRVRNSDVTELRVPDIQGA